MKKPILGMLLVATLAAAILAPSAGRAYPVSVNYSTYSCRDFLYMNPAEQRIFAGWLSGWYMQKSSTTVFDFTRFDANLASVTAWCATRRNVNDLLMSTLDRVMKSPASVPYTPGNTLDMTKITCGDYLKDPNPNNQKFIASWMSGYYSSKLNRSTVRWDRFEGNIRSVLSYCQKHKADTIMNVITNGNLVKVF